MSTTSATEEDARLIKWGPWAVFGGAVAILLFGGWLRRHTLDDAFINYRIVNQLQAGNGPVFNVGERVEAFTSPLWLALLAIGDVLLPFRLEWIGMVGGILAGGVGLVFAGLGARLLHQGELQQAQRRILIPLGALVLAVFPPIYRLIATGLEDGITITWLGACMWVLGRWTRDGDRLGLPGAVLLGLGVLVRPDLAPFTLVFLIAVLIGDRAAGWRRNTLMVVCAAAIPVASEILRMGYFGLLTPNTALAKSASLARWSLGWTYVVDTIMPYWFLVPVVILVVAGYVPLFAEWSTSAAGRRRGLVAAAFGAGALLCTIYIVRVGGDYMQTRLLLGALVGFICPVTFVAWPRRSGIGRIALAVTAGVWIVACGLFLRTRADNTAFFFEATNAVTIDDFDATAPQPFVPDVEPGQVYYLYDLLPYQSSRGDTPIVIDLGVGKLGYALPDDVYLLDALGLANPIAAHEELTERGLPGHEKLLTPPWIAALSTAPGSAVDESDFPVPDVSGFGTGFGSGELRLVQHDDPQGRPFDERVDTARGVLECDTMVRFRDSYSSPMSLGRFMSNLVRAPSNQQLTIPGEPADAADALCTPAERARIPGAD